MKKIAHCHRDLAVVARALAGELYETLMGDNNMFEAWRKQNPDCTRRELERRFVEKNWGKCLEVARKTLALQLRDPRIPETQKEKIIEILALDQTLLRGRSRHHQMLS